MHTTKFFLSNGTDVPQKQPLAVEGAFENFARMEVGFENFMKGWR